MVGIREKEVDEKEGKEDEKEDDDDKHDCDHDDNDECMPMYALHQECPL